MGDFEQNTFTYPNPAAGPSVTFRIHSPFRAKVLLKLYNIAGEIVFEKDFGEVAPAYQAGALTYVWSKVNSGGRQVARGLYYAVIRLEDSEGQESGRDPEGGAGYPHGISTFLAVCRT